MDINSVEQDDANIVAESSDGLYVSLYNEGYRERQELVLKNMREQGFISDEDYEAAINENIKEDLHPTEPLQSSVTTYFSDFCLDEIVEDLMTEYSIDESTARDMVYNKGLKIYSTINVEMQKIAEAQFESGGNFPGVSYRRDSAGNIVGKGKKRSTVLLYNINNYFKDDGSFVLSKD